MSSYAISAIPGLRANGRRAIGLLQDPADTSIDAAARFRALRPKNERTVRARMDYWIDGGHRNEYFHGWPQNLQYKECFVFKWAERKVNCRLYGFLCHPRKTHPSFQACILCYYDTKNRPDTDLAILDRINELRTDAGVINELERAFADQG